MAPTRRGSGDAAAGLRGLYWSRRAQHVHGNCKTCREGAPWTEQLQQRDQLVKCECGQRRSCRCAYILGLDFRAVFGF